MDIRQTIAKSVANQAIVKGLLKHEHPITYCNGLMRYLRDTAGGNEVVLFSIGSACWDKIGFLRSQIHLQQKCYDQMLSPLIFYGVLSKHILCDTLDTYSTIVIIDRNITYGNNVEHIIKKLGRLLYLIKEPKEDIAEYIFNILNCSMLSTDKYEELIQQDTSMYTDPSLTVFTHTEMRVKLVLYAENIPCFESLQEDRMQTNLFYRQLGNYTDSIIKMNGCVLFLNFVKFKSTETANHINEYNERFINDKLLEITLGPNNIVRLKSESEIDECLRKGREYKSYKKLLLTWNGYIPSSITDVRSELQYLMYIPLTILDKKGHVIESNIGVDKINNSMKYARKMGYLGKDDQYKFMLIPFTGLGLSTNYYVDYKNGQLIDSIIYGSSKEIRIKRFLDNYLTINIGVKSVESSEFCFVEGMFCGI